MKVLKNSWLIAKLIGNLGIANTLTFIHLYFFVEANMLAKQCLFATYFYLSIFFFSCLKCIVLFLLETNPRCSAVCITDSAALQTGWALGLRLFLTAHREAMDWCVSLRRLFKNTPSCDAPEQLCRLGFRPGFCFTSGQGHIDLRFIRSMLST